jgi:hypothetical protein
MTSNQRVRTIWVLSVSLVIAVGVLWADAIQMLGPAPRVDPHRPDFWQPSAQPFGPASEPLAAEFIAPIDTFNRRAVRNAYFRYYAQPMPHMAWTGAIASCDAGSISSGFREWTITRVNFVRAMAGVPGHVTLNAVTSIKAQTAALMFAANRQLSHFPPTTWLCYAAEGAEAAASSNIALSFGSPLFDDVIPLYMDDTGANNYAVGHRRWILYPPQTTMGVGSTPTAVGQWGANALWLIGGFGVRPPTPNGTPWPPSGYVPLALFPSSRRWSFSFPNANFGSSIVSMTADGVPVPLTVTSRTDSYADNAIVWEPSLSVTKGAFYSVSITGVIGAGVPSSFAYAVHPFDPADLLVSPTDFDGDGRAEILWRHTGNGLNAIWRLSGTSVAGTGLIPARADQNWRIAGTGDFNGDGKADILWRHGLTGQLEGWLMNGFAVASTGVIGTVGDSEWTIAGVGDFDGDGKADLLWRHATGLNGVWLMNGPAVAWSGFIATVADPAWIIAGTGDFNGDSMADILWRNSTTGAVAVWLMNRDTLTGSAIIAHVPSQWNIAGVGDYNGDGARDILWRNVASGQNAIWLLDGLTLANSAFIVGVPDVGWTIVGTGDYDGDGKADIAWRHTSTGNTAVWLMDTFSLRSSAFLLPVPDTEWTVASQ